VLVGVGMLLLVKEDGEVVSEAELELGLELGLELVLVLETVGSSGFRVIVEVMDGVDARWSGSDWLPFSLFFESTPLPKSPPKTPPVTSKIKIAMSNRNTVTVIPHILFSLPSGESTSTAGSGVCADGGGAP